MHERRLDRIASDEFVAGLDDKSDAELHEMKDEACQVETEVSYVRRLAQGRIDIVEAQRTNRKKGKSGISDLLEQLPQILAKDLRAPQAKARLQPNLAPDPTVDFTRGLEPLIGDDSLVRLPEMSEEELDDLLVQLRELEHDMSSSRKRLHEVIDTIDAEIARRAAAASA